MDSLANYGSDDDEYASSDEKRTENPTSWRSAAPRDGPKQQDVNYEEVQMDLSEESNDSKNGKDSSHRKTSKEKDREKERSDERTKERRDSEKYSSKREDDRNYPRSDRDRNSREDRDRNSREDRDRNSREDRDNRYKDRRDRDKKYRRSSSREKKRSRSKERDRKRSGSREKRRSRSPKREKRSRSRSRGRYGSKRYERANRMNPEKANSQQIVDQTEVVGSNNRFFMPGISGRFREQIEKRKLLWQKGKPDAQQPESSGNVMAGNSNDAKCPKMWQATTFAQDTDGKVANKFKRLMGIKGQGQEAPSANDILKKQEEMFTSMEAQYEVARTTTHTMRGVGFGFGNYSR